MVAYVRTVKTRSGAIAVQIVWSSRRGSRSIEHVGSAHDESELEALKAAARQRLAEGQGVWISGWIRPASPVRLWKSSVRMRGICGMPCAGPIPGSDLITRPEVMRCSEIWCWPGSSSRPVSRTRCGCCMKSVSSRSPTGV